ncbi:subtilisin-like serine protease QhpE [Novosphingobium profundi]|uniref:subtilisin-like serine protease QhpE n=1 Tax=Novosphingobium profundi TaxID=1774954 RepID=UPI001FEBD928|nr:S8 family serine peptidase [Novosphingobium profundi]
MNGPALPDPDRAMPALFPGRTGRGMRVAVIDSGVHPAHPHIDAARLAPGVWIDREGTRHSDEDATLDRLGHGTAVTAAILEKAPEATCLPIRVFADKLGTTARALGEAMRWAIEAEVDLINLSLGTPNMAHAEFFRTIVEEARDAGITVIAAHDAEGVPCLPGRLPGVLGVTLDWDCPRARYYVPEGKPGCLAASGYPRAIPGVAPTRNLYGISFAVAQVTGFAALAAEESRAMGAPPGDLHAFLAARLEAMPEPA